MQSLDVRSEAVDFPPNAIWYCVRSNLTQCLKLIVNSLPLDGRSAWLGLQLRAHQPLDTPLQYAIESGYFGCARVLLDAGADPNVGWNLPHDGTITTDIWHNCMNRMLPLIHRMCSGDCWPLSDDIHDRPPWPPQPSWLEILKLLSSCGASRAPAAIRTVLIPERGHMSFTQPLTVEDILQLRMDCPRQPTEATRSELQAARDWLDHTHGWCTPLHHLDLISPARARNLLRSGADVRAAIEGGPTPLSLASELRDAGRAEEGTAASLVLRAAFWEPQSHDLFPAAERARAWTLVQLGFLWSRSACFAGVEQALMDVWRRLVVPHAIHRERGH